MSVPAKDISWTIALAAPTASNPVAIGNDVQLTDLRDVVYKDAGNKDRSPKTLSPRQLGLYSPIEGKKEVLGLCSKEAKKDQEIMWRKARLGIKEVMYVCRHGNNPSRGRLVNGGHSLPFVP
jgi:hypothetical protein